MVSAWHAGLGDISRDDHIKQRKLKKKKKDLINKTGKELDIINLTKEIGLKIDCQLTGEQSRLPLISTQPIYNYS
jgi:hypothetical protein